MVYVYGRSPLLGSRRRSLCVGKLEERTGWYHKCEDLFRLQVWSATELFSLSVKSLFTSTHLEAH